MPKRYPERVVIYMTKEMKGAAKVASEKTYDGHLPSFIRMAIREKTNTDLTPLQKKAFETVKRGKLNLNGIFKKGNSK